MADALNARILNWINQCHRIVARTLSKGDIREVRKQAEDGSKVAMETANRVLDMIDNSELFSKARDRSRAEPDKGKCDAVLCIPTGIPLPPRRKRPRGSWMVILSERPGVDNSDAPAEKSANEKHKQEPPKKGAKEKKPDTPGQLAYRKAVNAESQNNPLKTPSTHKDDGLGVDYTVNKTPNRPGIDPGKLQMVTMFVENKKYSHTSSLDAINQGRMYCVGGAIFHASALDLHGALGSVFNLCTTGALGTLIMASVKPDISGEDIEKPPAFGGRVSLLSSTKV